MPSGSESADIRSRKARVCDSLHNSADDLWNHITGDLDVVDVPAGIGY